MFRHRGLTFLFWDGVLPLVVATVPSLLVRRRGPWEALGFLAIFLVPMIAALLRCGIGSYQLRTVVGFVSVRRQLALAAAIIVLLLFEIAVNVIRAAPDIPGEGWAFAAGLYAAYLVIIWATFRLPQKDAESRCLQALDGGN